MSKKVSLAIICCAALVLLYIFGSSVLYTSETLKMSGIKILFMTIAAVIVILAAIFLITKINSPKPVYIVLGIISIAAILRIIWVISVPTSPISDFSLYQQYAANAANGMYKEFHPSFTLFPFKLTYSLILSVIYRLFGINILYAKIFNILLSVITVLLLYLTGKYSFGVNSGYIAGLLFALWPSQIMYVSVLGSEHLFILLFILSVSVFLRMKLIIGSKKVYTYAAILGLILAITQLIRPISLLLIPVFLFILLFYYEAPGKAVMAASVKRTAIVPIMIFTYVACIFLINACIEPVTGVRISRSSSGFSLLIGTNFDSKGKYNESDAGLISTLDYDYEKVHSQAMEIALSRIKTQPLAFIGIMDDKIETQWADDSFGYIWSMNKLEYNSKTVELVMNYSRRIEQLSQAYYLAILLLSLIGCIRIIKRKEYSYITSVFILIFLIQFAAYLFLEVQERYHYPAIPFIMLIASFGYETFNPVSAVCKIIKKER